MINKPNIDKRTLSGTNTKITNLNKRHQVADKSRQLDLRLMQTMYTEANNAFKRWDQSKKGIDKQPENNLETALRNIERTNKEHEYPEDWQFSKPSMIEYKPLDDWISSSTRLDPGNLETTIERADTTHSDTIESPSSSVARLAKPVAEPYPTDSQQEENSSSGILVSNITETSPLDTVQLNAAETLEAIDTTQSNATVQAEPETSSDVTGSGEGGNSSSDTTLPITAGPSSSDPQSNKIESTVGVHSNERADPRDRQIVYREALVNGYTSKGEEIISHRNIGKNGKQYLIASGHPECPFPLYQLVPGGELTIWERQGYDIELAKENRRGLKSQWEERESTANGSEFDEALAIARAWSDNTGHAQVTFVWVRLKNGQSMWISRTNFGKLINSKKTGDTSITVLEGELDEKRKAWYREKNLSPPRPFVRPRIIKVSTSRSIGGNPSSGENAQPNGRESRTEIVSAEAENITQLVALQGEVNELKGMLRELMQRGEQ